MNEAYVTITGWVAAEPRYAVTTTGTPFLSLRVGCTPRRFDRQSGQWQDDDSLYVTVNCWRGLADNVNASALQRGTPVLVTGRLRVRQFERDDQWRFSAEVEALTLGPDLTRGTVDFRPVQRGGPLSDEDRRLARDAADQWALTDDPEPESEPQAKAA